MCLHKLHQPVGKLGLFSKVKVFASGDANYNFNELKSTQSIIIIVVLFNLFIVCSREVHVEYATRHFLIDYSSFFAKLEELKLMEVRWSHVLDRNCDENLFKVLVASLDNCHDSLVRLLVASDLFYFPVLHVVLKALFKRFRCVLFPVLKH